jgi:hypothetical protein
MIIETLNPLYANRAQNRTAIHTENRTRVDGPIGVYKTVIIHIISISVFVVILILRE